MVSAVLKQGRANTSETQLREQIALDEDLAKGRVRGGATEGSYEVSKGVVGKEVTRQCQRAECTVLISEDAFCKRGETLHAETVVTEVEMLENRVLGEGLFKRASSIDVDIVIEEREIVEHWIVLEHGGNGLGA